MKGNITSRLDDTGNPLHRAVFFAFIVCGVLLRMYSFQGFSASDPYAYMVLAHDASRGILHIPQYDGPPVFPLRIGVYLPTAGLFALFGVSEWAIALYPLAVSFLSMVLGYFFGRRLFGPLAGLWTLGFMAIIPIDHALSSALYPDLIAAFWGNLGLYLIYVVLTGEESDRRMILRGCLGGLCLGMSWLCKETVLYLAPLVACMFLFPLVTRNRRIRWIAGVSAILAAGAVLVAESVYLSAKSGEYLFRFHEIERNYEVCTPFFLPSHGSARMLLHRLFIEGPKQMAASGNFGGIPVLAVCAAVYAALFRRKAFLFPMVWFVSLAVIFNFASSSFSSYRPLPLIHRYLYPLVFPACVVSGGISAHLSVPRIVSGERLYGERVARWIFAVLLAGIAGICAYEVLAYGALKSEYPERVTARMVSEREHVYTDSVTVKSLTFFRTNRFDRDPYTRPYEGVSPSSIPVNSYVLTDTRNTRFLHDAYGYTRMEFEDHPPDHWRKIWEYDGAILYEVK